MFKCHTCNSKFTSPKELIQHISSVHVGGKAQNLSVLTVHEGNKHSEAILSKSDLIKQNKTVYMEEKSAKSEDFEEPVKHNSSEVSETLDSSLHEHNQLSNVQERLADPKSAEHKSTIHEGKKKVELKACMYCDYTFSSLVKLQKHLKIGHEEKKLNRCIYCDQNFLPR